MSRSGFYYEPKPIPERKQELFNRIDEIYTRFPYFGSPRITAKLKRDGLTVNHKAVEAAMREMGLQAIFPRKNTSKPNPQHARYPYLLRNLSVVRPNQVWGTDITYVRGNGMWFYLVAIMDWFSRYVVSWQLSQTMSTEFCLRALQTAIQNTSSPEIHNSDQGSQFTSSEYLDVLKQKNIQISMDGRGRCFDNIFTERLWRSVKYEEVYLKDYDSYRTAEKSLSEYFNIYNHQRPHQSLNYRTPAEVYYQRSKTADEIHSMI